MRLHAIAEVFSERPYGMHSRNPCEDLILARILKNRNRYLDDHYGWCRHVYRQSRPKGVSEDKPAFLRESYIIAFFTVCILLSCIDLENIGTLSYDLFCRVAGVCVSSTIPRHGSCRYRDAIVI